MDIRSRKTTCATSRVDYYILNRPISVVTTVHLDYIQIQRGSSCLPPSSPPPRPVFNKDLVCVEFCTLIARRFATFCFSRTNQRFMYVSAAFSTRLYHFLVFSFASVRGHGFSGHLEKGYVEFETAHPVPLLPSRVPLIFLHFSGGRDHSRGHERDCMGCPEIDIPLFKLPTEAEH